MERTVVTRVAYSCGSAVAEIEVQPKRRRGPDDSITVQCHELSFVEQFHVFLVVLGLETLLIGERREGDDLQCRELLGMFGAGLHDH